MITGIKMIQIAAHNGPQFVPELCTNAVIPSGKVFNAEVDNSTDAQSISPHHARNVKIAFVAVAGSIIGRTIVKNVLVSEHPSILAASIISVGMVLKKLR